MQIIAALTNNFIVPDFVFQREKVGVEKGKQKYQYKIWLYYHNKIMSN